MIQLGYGALGIPPIQILGKKGASNLKGPISFDNVISLVGMIDDKYLYSENGEKKNITSLDEQLNVTLPLTLKEYERTLNANLALSIQNINEMT
ncbi:MAG: hypothetical protein EZS28_054962, partial [Streblomastix strix]